MQRLPTTSVETPNKQSAKGAFALQEPKRETQAKAGAQSKEDFPKTWEDLPGYISRQEKYSQTRTNLFL
ncbi:MAG: hypothetical protein LBV80_08290 [Deltaproteobacteria bacterium]|jgi:hypothetical protein|nr:hypothetical protein [Deltaproteobacteria bacterium]